MLRDKAGRGDEHAARTARGVENATVIRFNDFGEKTDDGGRGIKLASALPLCHGELAEKVFVNAPKGVVVERGGNLRNFFQQFLEERAREKVVGLRQHTSKLRVMLFDVSHRSEEHTSELQSL